MNTNDILTIRKVCETGTIAKAANQLFMTPQAISVVIKRVENELGVSLFRRATGGMIMNDYGKAFYEKSNDLVRAIEEMERMFQLDPDNTHGVLRVAFTQGVIPMLTVRHVMSFTESHPNFRLELIEGPSKKIEDLVRTGKVDIGVTTSPFFSADEFLNIEWVKFEICAVYNTETPFGQRISNKTSIGLSELKDIPVVLQNKDFSLHNEFRRLCIADHGFEPEIYFETTEIANALAIAAGGSAVAIVPIPVAENAGYLNYGESTVKYIYLEDDLYWDWQFIKKKNDEISKIEQSFMDHLTAKTAEEGWF